MIVMEEPDTTSANGLTEAHHDCTLAEDSNFTHDGAMDSIVSERIDAPGDSVQAQATGQYDGSYLSAMEKLTTLKNELRDADNECFWTLLVEGLDTLCHAQCTFVATYSRVSEEDSDVEMLSLDDKTPSLTGVVVSYNGGNGVREIYRDYKSLAWEIPCISMNHDKVTLVEKELSTVLGKDAIRLPFPAEAYLAVPLFSSGRCYGHVGMLWTMEGLQQQTPSWLYHEMVLHSLEDLIVDRLEYNEQETLQQQKWERLSKKLGGQPKTPMHQNFCTTPPTFKPYARSLSHELRTPMQGVVGMLDIMYVAVQERIEAELDTDRISMFMQFRENIEAVQDSARRAIEAADNIVHAYNLNMQVLDTPQNDVDEDMLLLLPSNEMQDRPNIFIEDSNITTKPYKRRRSTPLEAQSSSPKYRCTSSVRKGASPRSSGSKVKGGGDKTPQSVPQEETELHSQRAAPETLPPPQRAIFPPMVLHYTKIRELIRFVINDSLHVGGRPDSARVECTELGERIEVQTSDFGGRASIKYIDWWVDPSVPESLCVDEKDLTKLVSCLFLNALKFTEVGEITVSVTVGEKPRCVLINVNDTGMGIPDDFLPNLFKPWAREDGSTTRSKEGLGLGLMVAKGLSRKLCGDLVCVRSSTTGPNRGSEFQLTLPLFPGDSVGRPLTPHTTSSAPRSAPPSVSPEAVLSPSIDSLNSSTNNEAAMTPLASPLLEGSEREKPLHPSRASSAMSPSSYWRQSGNSKPGPLKEHSFDKSMAEKHPLTFLVAEDNKINRRILVSMLAKLGYHDVYEAYDGKEAVRVMEEIIASHTPASVEENITVPAHSRISPDLSLGENPLSPIDAMDSTQTQTPPDSDPEPEKTPPPTKQHKPVDLVLMDLWMPSMDGYEATEKIFGLVEEHRERLAKLSLKDSDVEGPAPVASFDTPTVFAVSADVTDEALERVTRVGMAGYMTKPFRLRDLERLIGEFCSRKDRVTA